VVTILGQVLAWKSGLKVPLLHLGPSCPLQTILLSDPNRCDNPLQILMDVWRIFFNLKGAMQPLLSAEGCHTRSRKFKFKKVLSLEYRRLPRVRWSQRMIWCYSPLSHNVISWIKKLQSGVATAWYFHYLLMVPSHEYRRLHNTELFCGRNARLDITHFKVATVWSHDARRLQSCSAVDTVWYHPL
jgi:hypothetical protein